MLDDSLGVYATQPTGHLELLARLGRYEVGDAARVVIEERAAVRLRTLRGSAFLIPTALLPVTQGATRARNVRAFGGMLRNNLTTRYETWAARIEDLLAGGPLGRAEIRAALDPGEDGDLVRYVVSQMAIENRIVTVPVVGGWRADRVSFARWDDWLPGVDAWSIPEENARVELARVYLDRHGPATVADFSFWSGLTKTQARNAFAAVAGPVGSDYWASRPIEEHPPPPLRLLPIWDALFVTYRDRSRFVATEHYPFVYDASGNATSVVLVDGWAAGVWDLGRDDGHLEVKAAPFDSFTTSQWEAVADEAGRIGELIGSESVTVMRCEGPVDLSRAPRNRFMSPLR